MASISQFMAAVFAVNYLRLRRHYSDGLARLRSNLFLVLLGSAFPMMVLLAFSNIGVVHVPWLDQFSVEYVGIAAGLITRISFHRVSKWDSEDLEDADLRFKFASRFFLWAFSGLIALFAGLVLFS
jgi:hypothetical protein